MREIKFRAWIPVNDVETEYEMCYDLFWENFDAPLNDKLAEFPNLMQYTGLKDKNGKDIYEGDIVLVSKLMLYEDGFHEVIMKNGCFRAGRIIGKDLEYCEISGNVHENPELLEKK